MPNSPLVDFFLRTVPGHFDFLVAAHGMTPMAADVEDEQWVTLRYCRPDLIVEVTYGDDRDHRLNVAVAWAAPGESVPAAYGLSEWLKELGVTDWWVGMAGLWTGEAIDRHARRAADRLRDALPRILAAGPQVRRAMDRQRAAQAATYELPVDQQRAD